LGSTPGAGRPDYVWLGIDSVYFPVIPDYDKSNFVLKYSLVNVLNI